MLCGYGAMDSMTRLSVLFFKQSLNKETTGRRLGNLRSL